jgi:hypothetical protein
MNNGDNETMDTIDSMKCVICYELLTNLNEQLLYKLCHCKDSLVCKECLIYIQYNKMITCPVCRNDLNITKTSSMNFNICNIIKYYNHIILFIFINIFVYNIVIYYLFYNYNDTINTESYTHEFPNIIDKNYFINKLNCTEDFKQCSTIFILKKHNYFLFLNIIINLFFPLSLIPFYSLDTSLNINRELLNVFSCYITYLYSIINFIILIIICISKKTASNLIMNLKICFLLHSIPFLLVHLIYLYFFCKTSMLKFIETYKSHKITYNYYKCIKLEDSLITYTEI